MTTALRPSSYIRPIHWVYVGYMGDSTRIYKDDSTTWPKDSMALQHRLSRNINHLTQVESTKKIQQGDSTRIYKDDSTTWPKDSMALQHRLSLNNNGINKDESTKTNQQRRFSQNQQRRINKDESTKTNQSKSKFNRGIQLESTKPNHLLGIN